MKSYVRPRDDVLMSPVVEAARTHTSMTLTKQFAQQANAARKQFVEFFAKHGSGNQSPTEALTVTFGDTAHGEVVRIHARAHGCGSLVTVGSQS
jgi:hypothetical protein